MTKQSNHGFVGTHSCFNYCFVSHDPFRASLGSKAKGQDCGKAFDLPAREAYVIGGKDAEQGAWPWMVVLTEFNETTGDRSPICSGFLIDKRHVLTTAHCLRRNRAHLYSTRIGHVNLTLGDVYSIRHIAVHWDYEEDKFYDDIALLTLSEEVNVPNFNPVCLPEKGTLMNLTGRGTTFVGWGATENQTMSMTLKQLEGLPVVSNEICNEAYGERFLRWLPRGIPSGMICAGFLDHSRKDSCTGDSGGPLMIQESNRWYAVAISAFGFGCGSTNYPGVYTRVSKYLDWIIETKNMHCSPDEFRCNDKTCIESNQHCDGKYDCPDYSDERNCRTGATIDVNKPSELNCPWFNEQCDNAVEGQNACKDIRECDFAASILTLGGLPKVCGWVNNGVGERNMPTEWPKVCCGRPQKLAGALMMEFVMEVARKRGSTTSGGKEVEGTDGSDVHSSRTGQCALPLEPRRDSSEAHMDSVRFGNNYFSRKVFILTSEFLSNMLNENSFTMEFKTSSDNGVMFFVSDGVNENSYLGLIMRDGKLVYVFECGSGSALISSRKAYNDGKWHRVKLWRQGRKGRLVVDGNEDIRGNSLGYDTSLRVQSPIYVGGVDINMHKAHEDNLLEITSSFPGCIGNVKNQGKTLIQDMRISMIDTSYCYNKVEKGDFFTGRGFVAYYEFFNVGHLSFSLDIKPRSMSGILMAGKRNEDYFILQLIDGNFVLTFNNVTTTYKAADKNYLCDGQFHTIRVSKFNSSVFLTVDREPLKPWVKVRDRPTGITYVVYIGGLLESSMIKNSVRTTNRFVGCIRNIQLNQKPLSINTRGTFGHVAHDSCPTT